MTRLFSKLVLPGMFLATLMVSACATDTGAALSSEEQVKQRAQARLDAMMAGDMEAALHYTTPAFRSSTTRSEYTSRYAGVVNWTDAAVDSVSCDDERCDVKVSVTYQMVRPRIENTRSMDQVWIPVDGQWYIYER